MAEELDFDKFDAPDIVKELGKEGALTADIDITKPTGFTRRDAAQVAQAARQNFSKRKLATADAFDKIVEKYGDPLEELAKIGFDKENSVDVRLNALKELTSYGHSKLKTVEHTGANGEPLEFKMTVVQQILNLVNEDKTKVIEQAD